MAMAQQIKADCSCDQFKKFDPAEAPPSGREEFRHYVSHGPIRYPKEVLAKALPIGGRKFQPSWYSRFTWVEFSPSKNAAFCFLCRLFSSGASSQSHLPGHTDSAFTTEGYRNWNTATEKKRGFQQHAESTMHRDAEKGYASFLGKPVDAQIACQVEAALSARQERIARNRRILSRIFNVVRFIVRLGLPLRGHDEADASLNKGVFLELIDYLADNGDSVLHAHLKDGAQNATYLGPRTQNEMIEIIGEQIAEEIARRVRDAVYFAVLMDETSDLSHKEQVAIVLRYVSQEANGKFVIHESLIAVVTTTACTGEALAEILLSQINRRLLDVHKMVAQGYDGAAAMTSEEVGVQARIKAINPSCIFVLCYCHSLNRVLVNSLHHKSVPEPKSFFDSFELLISFMSASPYRVQYFIEAQGEGARAAGKGMSDTRWSSRSDALNRFTEPKVLQAAYQTLEHVVESSSDGKTRAIATGILRATQDFKFIIHLCAFQPVMSAVNVISKYLQSPEVDLMDAMNRIRSLKEEILRLRTDEQWEEIKAAATTLALAVGVEPDFPESEGSRKRKRNRRGDPRPETSAEFSVEASVRVKSYFTAVDKMLAELNVRFPDVLMDFAALQHAHHFDIDAEERVYRLAEQYQEIDSVRAKAQFRLFRQQVKASPNMKIIDLLNALPADYGELKTLYKILATLPVTTAGVERVFSKLLLVKSKLRTTMGQQRLESLLLAVCEREILASLKDNNLVATFAGKKDRRLLLG